MNTFNILYIDKEIRGLVVMINKLGLKTEFSCAGHLNDGGCPYVYWGEGFNDKINILKDIISNLEINPKWTVKRKSITLYDAYFNEKKLMNVYKDLKTMEEAIRDYLEEQ